MYSKVIGTSFAILLLASITAFGLNIKHQQEQASSELVELRQKVTTLSGQARQTAVATEVNGLAIRSFAEAAPSRPAPPAFTTTAALSNGAARPPHKTREEVRDELQVDFEHDATDAKWSKRETTEKLAAVLPPGVTLGSVECRCSMCRVETTTPDAPHFNEFVRTAFVDPERGVILGDSINARLGSPSDRPVVMVSYVSRSGPLPVTP